VLFSSERSANIDCSRPLASPLTATRTVTIANLHYHKMPISFPSAAGPSSTPSNDSYPSFPSSISGSDSVSDFSSDDGDSDDDEREAALIREEWEESLKQMQMLFSIVLVPFFGKWMGRRWSYWG
jgi:hypothetical protein